ncbi:hypothetical protein HNR77_003359 [Paenibacillus sp. JGP012]|nr:hypothetical protein [Paenibacillus sp. JGP012]
MTTPKQTLRVIQFGTIKVKNSNIEEQFIDIEQSLGCFYYFTVREWNMLGYINYSWN